MSRRRIKASLWFFCLLALRWGGGGHGKLQGPRAPRELLPGGGPLVDGEVLAVARHPQEQEHGLHPPGQQELTAPPGGHRERRGSLLLVGRCVGSSSGRRQTHKIQSNLFHCRHKQHVRHQPGPLSCWRALNLC